MLGLLSNALNFACAMEDIIFPKILFFAVSREVCPIFFDFINPLLIRG